MRGRGRNAPHRARAEQERQIPVAAADYCFINGNGGDEADTPALVIVDSVIGMIFAHAMARK